MESRLFSSNQSALFIKRVGSLVFQRLFDPGQSAAVSRDIYMFSAKDIYVSGKTYICPKTEGPVVFIKTIGRFAQNHRWPWFFLVRKGSPGGLIVLGKRINPSCFLLPSGCLPSVQKKRGATLGATPLRNNQ